MQQDDTEVILLVVPDRVELDDALQLSFQSILNHLLYSYPLGRIQRFGLLHFPQEVQVSALYLTVSGLQVGTLQPMREQETVKADHQKLN